MGMLITGGSRGIGAATAVAAADQGIDVAINFVNNESAAEGVVAECRSRGVKAIALQADVGDEPAVQTMFAAAIDQLGPIEVLVNNAGVLFPRDQFVNFSAERWQEVFRINAFGAFLCAREAIRHMSTDLGGSGGSIVNVSSAASFLGSPHEYVDYAATKGALDTMTIGLAKEVARHSIRVNAVRPGLIETDIHEEGRLTELVDNVPMGRTGTAAEVAAVILWLASPAASYVTGSLINCAGGR
jgi:NAD(P)-dependent dehydrogenase (short-subunit alcohol dehydrogenase family)